MCFRTNINDYIIIQCNVQIGQASVVGRYDRSYGFGITTTFYRFSNRPSLEDFEGMMKKEFNVVRRHLKRGCDVVIPCPTPSELQNMKYYSPSTRRRVINHNLGTGIANLPFEFLYCIQKHINDCIENYCSNVINTTTYPLDDELISNQSKLISAQLSLPQHIRNNRNLNHNRNRFRSSRSHPPNKRQKYDNTGSRNSNSHINDNIGSNNNNTRNTRNIRGLANNRTRKSVEFLRGSGGASGYGVDFNDENRGEEEERIGYPNVGKNSAEKAQFDQLLGNIRRQSGVSGTRGQTRDSRFTSYSVSPHRRKPTAKPKVQSHNNGYNYENRFSPIPSQLTPERVLHDNRNNGYTSPNHGNKRVRTQRSPQKQREEREQGEEKDLNIRRFVNSPNQRSNDTRTDTARTNRVRTQYSPQDTRRRQVNNSNSRRLRVGDDFDEKKELTDDFKDRDRDGNRDRNRNRNRDRRGNGNDNDNDNDNNNRTGNRNRNRNRNRNADGNRNRNTNRDRLVPNGGLAGLAGGAGGGFFREPINFCSECFQRIIDYIFNIITFILGTILDVKLSLFGGRFQYTDHGRRLFNRSGPDSTAFEIDRLEWRYEQIAFLLRLLFGLLIVACIYYHVKGNFSHRDRHFANLCTVSAIVLFILWKGYQSIAKEKINAKVNDVVETRDGNRINRIDNNYDNYDFSRNRRHYPRNDNFTRQVTNQVLRQTYNANGRY